MSEPVGAAMTLAALDALGSDPGTELVIVVGKPPRPRGAGARRGAAPGAGQAGRGGDPGAREVRRAGPASLHTVATLEDAAKAALAALSGQRASGPGIRRSR